jgi:hypothetical protein
MPTTLDLVKKAIAAMKERTGSSTIAITKWIVENEKVSLSCLGMVGWGSPKKGDFFGGVQYFNLP